MSLLQMKDADEGIDSTGDEQKQAVRKRRVRKDWRACFLFFLSLFLFFFLLFLPL